MNNIEIFESIPTTEEFLVEKNKVGGIKSLGDDILDYLEYNNKLYDCFLKYKEGDITSDAIVKVISEGVKSKKIFYTHFAVSVEGGVGVLKDVLKNEKRKENFIKTINSYVVSLNKENFSSSVVSALMLASSSRKSGADDKKNYEEIMNELGYSLYVPTSDGVFDNMPSKTFLYGDKSSSKNGTKRLCEEVNVDFKNGLHNKSVDLIVKTDENHILCLEEKTMNNIGGHQDRVWDEIVEVINRSPITYKNILISWGCLLRGSAQVKMFESKNEGTKLSTSKEKILGGLRTNKTNVFSNLSTLKDIL